MQINLTYDSSTAGAPAAFFAAMNYCVQYLDNLITNNVTVNIDVGWGEVGGGSIAAGDDGQGGAEGIILSYAQLKAALLAHSNSAADASAYANLPSADISNGAGFLVAAAEAKAWGLIPATGTELDGVVGFDSSTPWNFSTSNLAVAGEYSFVSVALQELTHALGRSIGLSASDPLTVLNLFKFASPEDIQTEVGGPSYFSVNGGATNLGQFATSSDYSDWSNTVPNDAFDAYFSAGTAYTISSTDITLLNVLGFSVNNSMLAGSGGGAPSVTVKTDDGSWEVGIGHVVTITLNASAAETVTGTPTCSSMTTKSRPMSGDRELTRCNFPIRSSPATTLPTSRRPGSICRTGPRSTTRAETPFRPPSPPTLASRSSRPSPICSRARIISSICCIRRPMTACRLRRLRILGRPGRRAAIERLAARRRFLAAPEFTAAFGAHPSNDAYVTELYANVLGRARTPPASPIGRRRPIPEWRATNCWSPSRPPPKTSRSPRLTLPADSG